MGFGFFLKKLISQLAVPPFNLLLVIVVGVLAAKRWPRTSRILIGSSALCLLVLATPAVSSLLIRWVNISSPLDTVEARSAQAIVILGGGLRLGTPEYGDTPNRFTLDRIRYGATVARLTSLPILVSGGAVIGQTPEGESMARALKEDFSVATRWVETRSKDTADNLQYAAAMLMPENISTVLLVTHDFHMRRALTQCARTNLRCIPAPVSLAGKDSDYSSWVYELPNSGALDRSALAIHELLGNLALVFH